jgi:uncharacterized phage protein (TIGR01671 family)
MRDILFRAKRIDNGEWVYGYYIKTHDYLDNREIHLIVRIDSTSFPANEITDVNEVNLETLGQYTGLTDKNGVKIFEGDICHFYGGEYYSGYWEINYTGKIEIDADSLWYLDNAEFVEIIGNVYDNSELLEVNNNG